MAFFLEWRRFTFFDIHKNIDNGKIAECLQDTTISVSTSGNGTVVLCDVTGWAYLISRKWEITSFKAYELNITLAQQLPHDPYLVTVGEDEPGVNPVIKVWNCSRKDRHGNPTLVRESRAVPSHMHPTPATALAVHDNKNLLALGFQDGCVSIFKGNIIRQRGGKMRTLPEHGTSPITGLFFKGEDKLFVVSRAGVHVAWLGTDRCVALDSTGAAPACSALGDRHLLTVGNNDAIFCYTTEERGPAYALKGEKVRLNWFRTYLVVTTSETSSSTTASTSKSTRKLHNITILDIQNKFIVFSKTFEEIDAVLTEWGSFYILLKNKEIIYLDQKDLQSKLSLLFKKNLYDVAIRIASSQHYDMEGLMEIYKQYGDHLYAKGDLRGAIDQYIKTIGWLETAYVIKKYLESRHLEYLVVYLEQIHKKGHATDDHTKLLLTCYVKIDQHDQQGKLKEFINSKENVIDFDVDVAIKVVRQASIDDALSLAANHKRHDWYLKIVLEDKKDYKRALDYIVELEFEDADKYMRKHGHRLIQHEPEESTKFLKLLCTDYKPRSKPLVDESTLNGEPRVLDKASPDDYIHLFLSNSEDKHNLIDFLEHMTRSGQECSQLVYNVLIEHYIHVWVKSTQEERKIYEEKVLKLLKDPEANYDKDQTLVICQTLGFEAGLLYLYEENKLYRAQISVHMRAAAAERALAVCRRRGAQCPRLWLDVLWRRPPPHALPELLTVVGNEKLLSPILVIDCLASTPTYTLGDVRKYLTGVLKTETEVINREQELATKYRTESVKMKAHIQQLEQEPVTFQSSRCSACNRTLELPSVYFLCQHSYHQHCFQSYSEAECECVVCARGARRPSEPAAAAETLHARLHTHHEPYAVVSEYYGRGLFNKVTVITESASQDSLSGTPVVPIPGPILGPVVGPSQGSVLGPATYGAGAEARLRLQEGQSKQVFVPNTAKQIAPKGTAVVPIPEGRMRLMEQNLYSSSLEANISKLEPVHAKTYTAPLSIKNLQDKPSSANVSPKISSAITNSATKNPFEEQNYDEAKNPFADEENDPKNPFNDDEDYDKNLNPFS